MKKVIVTGGAGFIGSHLVEGLVRKNYKVTVLDNLSTGNLKNLSLVKKKIKFIKCDLSKEKNLFLLFKNTKFVFHLAGLSKTIESIKNPKKYYKANVIATKNILNACRKVKIKKLIYAASASCYGNPREIPTSEKAKIKNLTPYAKTKWKAERLVINESKLKNFSSISLRFFNVYGPRSLATNSYSSVISIFLKQKLKNKPLTIYGDGSQTRDFIYVSDVVNVMLKVAKSKIYKQIFNVASQKSLTINKIAKIFGGKIEYLPQRKGEPKYSEANIKKIKTLLKWKPKVSINKGINYLLK
tara:strand:+ start:2377 stop:3273 length:897 start_codon:yes stop_codon:yes gene_type:complete